MTCASTSSIGLTMPVSTSSGDAPGHDTLTVTVGLLTSGNWLTPIRVTAMTPNRIVPNISIHANTGRRRQRSVMFTARPSGGDGPSPRPRRVPRARRVAAVPAPPAGRRMPGGVRAGAAPEPDVAARSPRSSVIVLRDLDRRAIGERLDAAHDEHLAGRRRRA